MTEFEDENKVRKRGDDIAKGSTGNTALIPFKTDPLRHLNLSYVEGALIPTGSFCISVHLYAGIKECGKRVAN